MVRFIHAADLHLDTPFKGLSNLNNELARRLKDATLKSFRKIIDLCIQKKVDFLVISGDVFDSESKSLKAQKEFISEVTRLAKHGINTYFNCGNHDPLNSWVNILQIPDKVYRFGSSEVEYATYQKNEIAVDIYGISFEKKECKENLAAKYKVRNDPSPISIAVYHGTVGQSGPHENYAPFELQDIMSERFDYWALGHIHKRQIVHEWNPTVVYPGNPQGRDFGETGAKGCYLVEIITGSCPKLEFIPTDLIRFEVVNIDSTNVSTINELTDKIEQAPATIADYNDNVSYIFRIVLFGKTALHTELKNPGAAEELIISLNDDELSQSNFIWFDKLEVKTQPNIAIEEIKLRNDFPSDVLKTFEQYQLDQNTAKALFDKVEAQFSNHQAKREMFKLSEENKNEIIENAKWKLLDQLLKQKE